MSVRKNSHNDIYPSNVRLLAVSLQYNNTSKPSEETKFGSSTLHESLQMCRQLYVIFLMVILRTQ
jgi:hypothetical protein